MKTTAGLIVMILLLFGKNLIAAKKENIKKQLRTPQNLVLEVKDCLPELEAILSEQGAVSRWEKQAPVRLGERNFRSPSSEFGKWIEVVINKNGIPKIYASTNDRTLEIEFDDLCESKRIQKNGMDFRKTTKDKSKSEWLDDIKLKKILGRYDQGIIYVWSPEMIYSAKYWKEFRDVAKRMNLAFIPLIDPRASLIDVAMANTKYGIEPSDLKLNSVELYMRNLTIHYPTSLVFSRGRLSDTPIVGVMPEEDLKRAIQVSLSDIGMVGVKE